MNVDDNHQKFNNKQAKDFSTTHEQKAVTCTYCKNRGHSWKECRKLKSNNERKKFSKANQKQSVPAPAKPSAFRASLHEFSEVKYTCIIDSGAFNHMSPYRSFMIVYQEFDYLRRITLGNGDHLSAFGVGKVPFQSGELNQVLWVPKLTENLFSVVKVMKLSCNVQLNQRNCTVDFLRNGKLVLQGKKKENSTYFLLNLKPTNEQLKGNALLGATLGDWHRRLSHCSKETVKQMIKNKTVEVMTITNEHREDCESCIMSNICRSSHPNQKEAKADKESATLHIDLVGPIKTQSLGGGKYFLLATEEYSKYLYLETSQTKVIVPNSSQWDKNYFE